MGEKIFMMLLLEAWSICTTNANRTLLVQTDESFVNTCVCGTNQSHSQWKIPINREHEIDQISFTVWRVRKIIRWLTTLVPQLKLDGA